jgi:hypothetical protein
MLVLKPPNRGDTKSSEIVQKKEGIVYIAQPGAENLTFSKKWRRSV